jgi:transcription initiation factor TFIID subunit 6
MSLNISFVNDICQDYQAEIAPAHLVPMTASADYNLRVVIQEALKFARHSKRTRLTTNDINKSLRTLNTPPTYVGTSRDPLALSLARTAHEAAHDEANMLNKSRGNSNGGGNNGVNGGNGDDDDESSLLDPALFAFSRRVALHDLKRVDLPRIPLEPALSATWLAVEGHPTGVAGHVGATTSRSAGGSKKKRKRGGGGRVGNQQVVVDPGVYHSLSHQQRKLLAELLSKTTPILSTKEGDDRNNNNSNNDDDDDDGESSIEVQQRRRQALHVLSSSSGLQPLLPYLTHHVTSVVNTHLKGHLLVLRSMLHLMSALLVNVQLDCELYLDQLLPCIFSCLVGKRISHLPTDDHWSVRDCAAVVRLFSCVYNYA